MIIGELIIQNFVSHIPLVWMQWVSRNWGWTTLLYLVRGAEEIFPGLKVETRGETSKTKNNSCRSSHNWRKGIKVTAVQMIKHLMQSVNSSQSWVTVASLCFCGLSRALSTDMEPMWRVRMSSIKTTQLRYENQLCCFCCVVLLYMLIKVFSEISKRFEKPFQSAGVFLFWSMMAVFYIINGSLGG